MPHADPPHEFAGRDCRSLIAFLAIAIVVLAVDLAMKALSFQHVSGQVVNVTPENANDPHLIPPHQPITVIPKVLSLKLTINHGAVFGLGAGGRVFFIGVTLIAIAVIVTIFWRSDRKQRIVHVALAMILAGAIGNLYDRIVHGAVRDMLYLFPCVKLPFGFSWPGGSDEVYPWIFNVADAGLVVGVILMLWTLMRKPTQRTKPE
jgi:signal peptidase II